MLNKGTFTAPDVDSEYNGEYSIQIASERRDLVTSEVFLLEINNPITFVGVH
jgi:hypothetical protein